VIEILTFLREIKEALGSDMIRERRNDGEYGQGVARQEN